MTSGQAALWALVSSVKNGVIVPTSRGHPKDETK